jgi:hypothetical protein
MERLERNSLSSRRSLARRIRILRAAPCSYPIQRGGGVPLVCWILGRIE